MGRNEGLRKADVRNVIENDEEERKIRINQNLARFLTDQANHQAAKNKRQMNRQQKNSLLKSNLHDNPPSNKTNNIPNYVFKSGPKSLNQSQQIGEKSTSQIDRKEEDKTLCVRHNSNIRGNKDNLQSSKNLNCTSPICKHPINDDERQNILNNNIDGHGSNTNEMQRNMGRKLPTLHNQTNKRCTMTVSKLFGRSVTFSYNHDALLDPMDLLDPELRPIPPQPGCEPSMQIYQDHRRMATDYLNVRNEIVEMRQRKQELEEALQKSDEELLRSSVISNNDRTKQQYPLPSTAALQVQNDPAEIEKYLQLESEKDDLAKFRDKLATQLELIKQSQVKKNQQKCSESNSAQPKGNAPSNRVEKISTNSDGLDSDTEWVVVKSSLSNTKDCQNPPIPNERT